MDISDAPLQPPVGGPAAAGDPPSTDPHQVRGGAVLVLRVARGRLPRLPETVALARALRRAVADATRPDPVLRALASGHAAGGGRLDAPHVAYLPLPSVDQPGADGRLRGLAVVLPAGLGPSEQDGLQRAVVACLGGARRVLRLRPLGGRAVELAPATGFEDEAALRPTRWLGPARRFATVTPIVLDRMPPRGCADRHRFVVEQVVAACRRVGLPAPAEVELGERAALPEIPPTRAFPGLAAADGRRRRHVHAVLRFDRPVAGPLVLGAGRHVGMGLLAPLGSWERRGGEA